LAEFGIFTKITKFNERRIEGSVTIQFLIR